MTDLAATTTKPNDDLINIFNSQIIKAEELLKSANNESLFGVTSTCLRAFAEAAIALDSEGILPIVLGTDPHAYIVTDRSALSSAMSSVYGFATPHHAEKSPNAVAALKELQVLANEIHSRGYAIFT